MIDDDDDIEAEYLHDEDGSRVMCSQCCEWLLDDGSCPDADCEHNRTGEDE